VIAGAAAEMPLALLRPPDAVKEGQLEAAALPAGSVSVLDALDKRAPFDRSEGQSWPAGVVLAVAHGNPAWR